MSVSAFSIIARLLAPVDKAIDRLIGADDLAAHDRNKLLRQQLRSTGQMALPLLVGSLLMSAIFLALTWGSARFVPLLGCLLTIELIYLCCTLMVRSSAKRRAGIVKTGAVVKTLVFATILGGLWGIVLNVLPVNTFLVDVSPVGVLPEGDGAFIRSAAIIGVGGIIGASMMALINYPQAFVAFIIPVLIGVGFSVAGLNSSTDMWIRGTLWGVSVLLVTVIAFRQARLFVDHCVSRWQVQDKREIIALLLGEFEESTSDWIWGFDGNGRLNRLSGGFTVATGVEQAALLGADFVHFLRCITPPDDPLMAQIAFEIDGKQTFQNVELRVTAGGQECWWSLTGKPTFDESGMYMGYIGIGADISERKITERRITLMAHHDSLTGLLNRTKFTEQLNQSVARLERYGTPFSVLFLDLDQFKSVNDTRGHIAGDKLLVMVARRIEALVRDTDFVARLGGDEFVIIVPNDAVIDHLSGLAMRLLDEIKKPYEIDGDTVSVGVSVGIAMAPLNGTRPDQILRNADLALYRAKADGRSVFRFFENEMDSESRARRLLEVELRDALKSQELVLYYQPLVSAEDAQPTGFEALIRWNHPVRGVVAPAEFIPVAEQSNLIVDIGDWTIAQACTAAATWPDHLTVAVNLSAKHFRRSDIALVIKKALAMSGIAPERLEIEITEGLLMDQCEQVAEKLMEIHALGVTITMDDFGTGHSSLSYLLKFPFDKIKIDRSFVEASSNDAVARDILKAITAMGKTLKLKITAEGVETREQADFLSEIACHQLQGFYFARPLDPIDMPYYLLTSVPTRERQLKAEAEAALAG